MAERTTMTRPVRPAGVILLVLSTPFLWAQEPSTRPQFQVASVKANKSGESSLQFEAHPGGRFLAVNIPLKQLIRAAYALQLYQILNAPAWVDAERFDISAIAARDITPTAPWTPGKFAPVQLMIQSLLADRFKLVAHYEMRPSQVYSLVLNQPEPRRATNLTPAATDTQSMQIGTKSLLLHKLRSVLTMLGIIFGVCSVIAMLAIG